MQVTEEMFHAAFQSSMDPAYSPEEIREAARAGAVPEALRSYYEPLEPQVAKSLLEGFALVEEMDFSPLLTTVAEATALQRLEAGVVALGLERAALMIHEEVKSQGLLEPGAELPEGEPTPQELLNSFAQLQGYFQHLNENGASPQNIEEFSDWLQDAWGGLRTWPNVRASLALSALEQLAEDARGILYLQGLSDDEILKAWSAEARGVAVAQGPESQYPQGFQSRY